MDDVLQPRRVAQGLTRSSSSRATASTPASRAARRQDRVRQDPRARQGAHRQRRDARGAVERGRDEGRARTYTDPSLPNAGRPKVEAASTSPASTGRRHRRGRVIALGFDRVPGPGLQGELDVDDRAAARDDELCVGRGEGTGLLDRHAVGRHQAVLEYFVMNVAIPSIPNLSPTGSSSTPTPSRARPTTSTASDQGAQGRLFKLTSVGRMKRRRRRSWREGVRDGPRPRARADRRRRVNQEMDQLVAGTSRQLPRLHLHPTSHISHAPPRVSTPKLAICLTHPSSRRSTHLPVSPHLPSLSHPPVRLATVACLRPRRHREEDRRQRRRATGRAHAHRPAAGPTAARATRRRGRSGRRSRRCSRRAKVAPSATHAASPRGAARGGRRRSQVGQPRAAGLAHERPEKLARRAQSRRSPRRSRRRGGEGGEADAGEQFKALVALGSIKPSDFWHVCAKPINGDVLIPAQLQLIRMPPTRRRRKTRRSTRCAGCATRRSSSRRSRGPPAGSSTSPDARARDAQVSSRRAASRATGRTSRTRRRRSPSSTRSARRR